MSSSRTKETIAKGDVGELKVGPKGELAISDFPGDRPLATSGWDDDADAGLGLEDLSANEQVTPFLVMLQGLSPQLNPSKAQYVRGASLGDIVDSGTQEVYPGAEGVDILVCARWYGYKMWIPRDLDGGFRGDLLESDRLVRDTIARMAEKYGPKGARFNMPRYDGKTRKWSDPPAIHPETGEEIELQETGQLYVIYAPPGHLASRERVRRAIVNFKSTSLSAYTGHLARHNGWTWPTSRGEQPAALWRYKYRLTTIDSNNAKGEFKVWQTHLAPPATTYHEADYRNEDPDLYRMGHEFYDLFKTGGVKVDQAAERVADSEEIPL
jgi:hypothetical protein